MIAGRRSRAVALTGAFLCLAAPISAQPNSAKADPLDPLRACRTITDASDRLACFDRVSAALLQSADAGDLGVVDREEVRRTRRTLFGFTLPDLGIFGRGERDKERGSDEAIEILETTIAGVRTTAQGLELTTAEGAVWLISAPPRRLSTPRPGQKLELRKGTLSSYFLRIDGQGGVKGRRIG